MVLLNYHWWYLPSLGLGKIISVIPSSGTANYPTTLDCTIFMGDNTADDQLETEADQSKLRYFCQICDDKFKPWSRGVGTSESPVRVEHSLCEHCAGPDCSDEAEEIFGWTRSRWELFL